MNTNPVLSAVIITFNEIDHIKECIASIDFADEIIAVDSYSSDGTWEWLKSHPQITAVQHPFRNFTEQKNFALAQATGKWVYFLDADERVTPALKEEISEVIALTDSHDAYWNYRSFMFQNKRLYFSGWQTDKVYRLFKREKCRFTDKRIVHETLEVNGTEGYLKEKLIHYSYKDFDDYRSKMLHYGRLKAVEAHRQGKSWTIFHQYLRPTWKFFNHFFLRMGFLDGSKGATISYLNALGVFERYRELKKLKKRQ
ncbi:glycosyltransferase family 2 protein [Robertkochia aurantiaca]|uniref:glycosyltransferase family 2 protein n=1 Tax=Robertkochia aurantiaca TaxID=2873700 RepID=UPI001CD01BAD|nr:glycosyltransferase family 2 protein [Robertkochia sp. 3YJGBD-33]